MLRVVTSDEKKTENMDFHSSSGANNIPIFHGLFSACANPQMGGLLIGTITPRGEGGNQANVVE